MKIHWSPGQVRGLGETPPSCANWSHDEKQFLSTSWDEVTCEECIIDRSRIERMWSSG